MKVLIAGRRRGKTTKAVKWAKENDAYIVVHSKQEATRVFHDAQDKGIQIRFPITFDELLHGGFGRGVQALVFDNVDMLLAHLARGTRVVGFTATGEKVRVR